MALKFLSSSGSKKNNSVYIHFKFIRISKLNKFGIKNQFLIFIGNWDFQIIVYSLKILRGKLGSEL